VERFSVVQECRKQCPAKTLILQWHHLLREKVFRLQGLLQVFPKRRASLDSMLAELAP
jgi:hypothetical protein